MKTTRTLTGLALGAALALAACSEGSTAPDLTEQALTYHAAIVAADATLEDVTLARTPFAFGPRGEFAFGAGPGPAGRPGGHQGVGGPLTGTRSVTFYDGAGNTQEAYDSLTTASIHFVLDLAGDVSRGPWSGSVSRTRDMTVTGLLGAETTRTHNGSGSETVSRSRTLEDGLEATFDMQGTFTQKDLVVPVPGSEPRYPLSGTITRNMTVTVVNGPRGDVTKTVTAVITFDGDNTATAVVNGETFEIDLDAREGGHPLKGRFGGRNGG